MTRLLSTALADLVRPTAAERRRLLLSEPIARLLSVKAGNETAVFGAIWIDATKRKLEGKDMP